MVCLTDGKEGRTNGSWLCVLVDVHLLMLSMISLSTLGNARVRLPAHA